MKKVILLLSFLGCVLPAFGQNVITGIVLDAKTKEKLTYCHVINLKSQEIYITNGEGEFKINDTNKNDSLKISYLGYTEKTILTSDLIKSKTVLLDQDNFQLQEIKVKLNDKELINLITKAANQLRKSRTFQSKAYLELYSEDEKEHIELLQSYYNVTCKGANISDFRIKAGKIALTENVNKLFVNLGSTYALTLLNPAYENINYPKNPLNFSGRQLSKKYYIRAMSDLSPKNDLVHLEFEPIKLKDTTVLFSGEIWISKSENKIMKLRLFSRNLKYYPFKPIREQDELKKVAVEMNYYFNEVNKKHRLTLLTFDYGFEYFSAERDTLNARKIHTDGLVHLYDDQELFFIPIMEFDSLHNDYRKASMIPYDSVFWKMTQSVPATIEQIKRYQLFANSGILLNFEEINRYKSKDGEKNPIVSGFFEHNNIVWDSSAVIRLKPHTSTSNIADLNIQFFVDVNKYNDKLYFTTKTILDVFKTNYSLENKPEHLAYINIYFDLAEIIRRKLQTELESTNDQNTVISIHRKYSQQLFDLIERYKKDLNFGKNIRNFKEWNTLITKELKRDHIKHFKLIIPNY